MSAQPQQQTKQQQPYTAVATAVALTLAFGSTAAVIHIHHSEREKERERWGCAIVFRYLGNGDAVYESTVGISIGEVDKEREDLACQANLFRNENQVSNLVS